MIPSQLVFKVNAQCNIACTYCYQDALAPETFRSRYQTMDVAVLGQCLDACFAELKSRRAPIRINLQGGEPLLVGLATFARYLDTIRESATRHGVKPEVSIQTNALLLDDAFCALLEKHEVTIGVSIDGPPDLHDRRRIDKGGHGTGKRVEAKIALALRAGARVAGICVADPEADSAAVYEYFCRIGLPSVHILLPAQNHATSLTLRDARSYAPFLKGMFDAWAAREEGGTRIADFEEVVASLLGLTFRSWVLNAAPSAWTCFLPDGAIETGDPYGICQSEATRGESVLDALRAAMKSPSFVAHARPPAPRDEACRRCEFLRACGGGFPTFRYARKEGFEKRTVYCDDTRLFYAHVREHLTRVGAIASHEPTKREEHGALHRQ